MAMMPGLPGGPRPPGPTQPNPLLPGVAPPGVGLPPPPGAQQPTVPPGGGNQLMEALKQAGIELPNDPGLVERDLGRRSPRGSYDHVYEIVSHELAQWLDRMPKVLATAMRGGPHKQGPFKHPATGKQKYEIYKAKLFEEDGTPNIEGRKELLGRMTPRQYAEVVHIVTRQMRREDGVILEEQSDG